MTAWLSPFRVYAILAILACAGAGVAYHLVVVAGLEVSVANMREGKVTAEKALSQRIAAEATTVAAAVQKARADERAMYDSLKKEHDELQQAKAADARVLGTTRQRLYELAAKRSACPSGGDLPASPAPAAGADGTAARLPERDQQHIDRLLRLGAQANEATRQRDLAVKLYNQNCVRN